MTLKQKVLESHIGQRIHVLVKCFQWRALHRVSVPNITFSSWKLLKKNSLINVKEQIGCPWWDCVTSLPSLCISLSGSCDLCFFAFQSIATSSLFKKELPCISVENFHRAPWWWAKILRPETYVPLNLRSDYSPVRIEGRAGDSNLLKCIPIQATIPLCNFTNKVIHLHLSTAIGVELKLAFNQPWVCRENSILFQSYTGA